MNTEISAGAKAIADIMQVKLAAQAALAGKDIEVVNYAEAAQQLVEAASALMDMSMPGQEWMARKALAKALRSYAKLLDKAAMR